MIGRTISHYKITEKHGEGGMAELPVDWNPEADKCFTIWEATQHLVRAHERKGEDDAAALLTKLGSVGEIARDLADRLYSICDSKKWVREALPFHATVVAWPRIAELAKQAPAEQKGSGY